MTTYQQTGMLQALLGGQPYLTRRALDAPATGKHDPDSLLDQADWEDGPLGDHLERVLASVSGMPEVLEFVKRVLAGDAQPHQETYHRLHAAGVLKQDRAGKILFRCEMYRRYLEKHLL